MATTEALNEYKQLLEQIVTSYQYGKPFVRAVFLGITLNVYAPAARNSYIQNMGKHFGIDKSKVNRIIELLPS
ncbi:MAG: hypothetical protein ACK5X3_21325 [Pseudomonadota bacterium]|jgi:hypothetical protein